jgi:hypothetical protein
MQSSAYSSLSKTKDVVVVVPAQISQIVGMWDKKSKVVKWNLTNVRRIDAC